MHDISFFRNRFYDQVTGRWTQEDPVGVAGGINLYGFNGNNPVAYTDPFGLCKPMPECEADAKKVATKENATASLVVSGTLLLGYMYANGVELNAVFPNNGDDGALVVNLLSGVGLGASLGASAMVQKGGVEGALGSSDGEFHSDQPTQINVAAGVIQPSVQIAGKGQKQVGTGAGWGVGPGLGVFVTQPTTIVNIRIPASRPSIGNPTCIVWGVNCPSSVLPSPR